MSNEDRTDLNVAEARPELKKPSMYEVLLINDDYTPMDFVVEVLTYFFSMNMEKATQVMLQVHTEGEGVCGVFPHDVAETKVAQAAPPLGTPWAKKHQHPLMCVSQKLDDDE